MRAGLPLVVGDVARYVRRGAGAPFQAVILGKWRGVGGGRLMRRPYSAAAHVGYRAAIIAVRARGGLRGRRAQLLVAAESPAFNVVDLVSLPGICPAQ